MSAKMKLEDWLDDLCVRFIINLPEADLTSMQRLCFLVEEAHWFYEDFIRPLDHSLPAMSLRNFCLAIFQRCPLLAPFPIQDHIRAFEEFLKYKTSIPVRGAILLNEAMDMALLVKGWKKSSHWSFPRGKIAMDEDDLDCAIREVAEETGFDVREAGLVPPPEDVKYFDSSFRDQQVRLYAFRNVPMDTYFEPRTRKEISKIQWYKISDLPTYRKKNANNNNNGQGQETDDPAAKNANKFYMVAQFIGPLKKWIAHQRKKDALRGTGQPIPQHLLVEETYTEDEAGNQTEPPSEYLQSNGPPVEMMENATRELQRLLNVQPQPSGQPVDVPPSAAFAIAAPTSQMDPNQNKANALLAVLQQSGGGNPQLQQQQQQQQQPPPPPNNAAPIPHTPLDHTYNQAPQPHTPHHHHPAHNAPLASYPPPPQFQIQMQPPHPEQNLSNPQYNQYGASRPDLMQMLQPKQSRPQPQPRPPQEQQPPMQQPPPMQQQLPMQQQQLLQSFQRQPQQQMPQMPPAPANVQQFMSNNGPQFLPPPPPYQVFQQQVGTPGMPPPPASRFQPEMPPVPLLHPQPLPPNVQNGLLARESFTSPEMSDVGPNQRRAQQPLSNHAASLLNTLKSGNNARQGQGDIPAGGNAGWPQQQPPQQMQQQQPGQQPRPQQQQQQQPRPQQPPQMPQQVQPQSMQQPQHRQQQISLGQLFGTAAPAQQPYGNRPQPEPQMQLNGPPRIPVAPTEAFAGQIPMPRNNGANNNGNAGIVRPQQLGPNGPGPQFPPNFRAQQPSARQTDKQRNALLGMFKQQTPTQTAAQASSAPEVNEPPVELPAAVVEGQATAPPQTGPLPTGVAIEMAAQANGGPIEMNPELNLPFGALSLLTRPKASAGSAASGSVGQSPAPGNTPATSKAHLKGPVNVRGTGINVAQQQSQLQPQASMADSQPSAAYYFYDNMPPPAVPASAAQQQQQQQSGSIRRPSYASGSAATGTPDIGPSFLQSQAGAMSRQGSQATQGQGQAQAQTGPVAGRRSDVRPEQKQKLLSLFGKPQQQAQQQQQLSPPSGSGLAMVPPGSASVSSRGSFDLSAVAAAAVGNGTGSIGKGKGKDVAAGIAAAAANSSAAASASRRGSQTPISPADRSFLLGYLASMSGTTK